MKKVNESLGSFLKNFNKYGPLGMKEKWDIDKIIELVNQGSFSNENISLTPSGLILRIGNTTTEINKIKNFINLNGAIVYASKKEIKELYDKVLENSFK